MRPHVSLSRDRKAQTAIADAIIALVILSIASGIIYGAVSGVVTGRSEARQRADLKAVALQAAGLVLEASYPEVSYTEVASGKAHTMTNLTGEGLFRAIFELKARSNASGLVYDLSSLEAAIADLYKWTLEGRYYAVNAEGTLEGVHIVMFFSPGDGERPLASAGDVPHPRIVAQRTVHDLAGDISVDLYLWK